MIWDRLFGKRETAFVVVRPTFYTENDSYQLYEADQPSHVPVAVFLDRAAAEAHARNLELRERPALDPFRLRVAEVEYDGGRARQFNAYLRGAGVPPLETAEEFATQDELAAWWAAVRPGLTDDQINAIWDYFPDRLYTVAEIPLEG